MFMHVMSFKYFGKLRLPNFHEVKNTSLEAVFLSFYLEVHLACTEKKVEPKWEGCKSHMSLEGTYGNERIRHFSFLYQMIPRCKQFPAIWS